MSERARHAKLHAAIGEPVLAIGGLALVVMMLATVADVAGRNLVGISVPGVVEIVSLAMVWCTFAGIGAAFVAGGHITVDLVDTLAPRPARTAVRVAAATVSVGAMALLAWLAAQEFAYAQEWGDTTVDLGIPVTAFWIAIAGGYGVGTCAALAALLVRNGR